MTRTIIKNIGFMPKTKYNYLKVKRFQSRYQMKRYIAKTTNKKFSPHMISIKDISISKDDSVYINKLENKPLKNPIKIGICTEANIRPL